MCKQFFIRTGSVRFPDGHNKDDAQGLAAVLPSLSDVSFPPLLVEKRLIFGEAGSAVCHQTALRSFLNSFFSVKVNGKCWMVAFSLIAAVKAAFLRLLTRFFGSFAGPSCSATASPRSSCWPVPRTRSRCWTSCRASTTAWIRTPGATRPPC